MSFEDKLSKYFPSLSEEKVAELTDEQVTKAVNLECARQGIPLFLESAEKPTLEPKADVEMFAVGGWMFANRDEAEKVVSLVKTFERFKPKYDYRNYKEEKTTESDDGEIKVEVRTFFSPASYHKYKAELTVHSQRVKEYEEEKAKLESATDAKQKVIGEVWEVVNDCRHVINRRARTIELYEKYVQLAEGDRQIAWNFLRRAENLTSEDIATMKLHEANELGGLTMEELTPEEQVLI